MLLEVEKIVTGLLKLSYFYAVESFINAISNLFLEYSCDDPSLCHDS